MVRTLRALLRAANDTLDPLDIAGTGDPEIHGIAWNSRNVSTGYAFFACSGERTDGHRYIDEAIGNGASVIFHSDPVTERSDSVVYVRVQEPRTAMAHFAAAYYGNPSGEMTVIGVTGTNGKTTTVYLIQQLYERLGFKAGMLSTALRKTNGEPESNPTRLSTPESPDAQALLREMADAGCEYAVVEATSHGLSQRNARLVGIELNVAVLTNITHEHLEFHGSLEQYRSDKANLFRFLDHYRKEPSFGVINGGTENSHCFTGATKKPLFTYTVDVRNDKHGSNPSHIPTDASADIVADRIDVSPDGSRFVVTAEERSFEASIGLPGVFNIANSLAALLVVSKTTGIPLQTVASRLPELRSVPGRMMSISAGQPFYVIVDFAHSPDAFTNILPFFRDITSGKLIVVFGSAGDRDTEKRPIQGAIADTYADTIMLTDEDPRSEDPATILGEIASGCSRSIGESLRLIPDRKEAIRAAFQCAQPGDTVLLLGKGHEKSIEYRSHSLSWNEAEIATSLLAELGYDT